MMRDEDYMKRALDLAGKGRGRTNPNPAVGCVIVKKGTIVGEGWHRVCGGPHAEIFALRQAGAQARGAQMYVTLEPCAHQGRTGPCVDQIIAHGLERVVIAMTDPNPAVSGRSVRKMRRAGIKVSTGCLKSEAVGLNPWFAKWITQRIPLVTLKTAQTLDGKIASAAGRSKWITSSATRRHTRRLRNDFDAILVGVNTVLSDNPRLDAVVRFKPWTKVVMDSRLRIPLTARLFCHSRVIVATTAQASQVKIRRLEARGVTVVVCPAVRGKVSVGALLKELGRRSITNILVEGGASVSGAMLKAKAADRMLTVIAPKILGDQQALSAVQGLNIRDVNRAIGLDIETVYQLGRDWIFEGSIVY